MTLPLSSSECSYLPKNRATGDCSHNAPRSARKPIVRVPPFHTTLRHFTPHPPTGQPLGPKKDAGGDGDGRRWPGTGRRPPRAGGLRGGSRITLAEGQRTPTNP